MKKSLIHHALKTAIAHIENHAQYKFYLHYTFIVQNNRIVEWGTNTSQEPKKHFGYHSRVACPKMHAEIEAYKKAKGLLGKKPFEAINIRLTRSGECRMSKPCKCCHSILRELGCSKFWYSSEIGFMVTK